MTDWGSLAFEEDDTYISQRDPGPGIDFGPNSGTGIDFWQPFFYETSYI